MISNRLIDALFCDLCFEINIMKESFGCYVADCQCLKHNKIKTLLDFYAKLYVMMDNENYIEFVTLEKDNEERIHKITKEIDMEWKEHIDSECYDRNEHLIINSKTICLVKKNLKKSKNNEELLIRIILWIRRIDFYLGRLIDYKNRSITDSISFDTSYGVALVRIESKIAKYIIEERKKSAIINPDRLRLRNFVKNVHISKNNYQYSANVKHLNIQKSYREGKEAANMDIRNYTIGMVSDDFSAEDYIWKIEDNRDTKYFYFTGVSNNTEYHAKVLNSIDDVMKGNPHVVILPELFTPKELLVKVKDKVKGLYRNNISNNHNLMLFLTGSFHLENEMGIYNVAEVLNSTGKTYHKVYKQNLFEIESNSSYKGVMKNFESHKGLEKINFNKREIIILDSDIGRIGIVICIDFLIQSVKEIMEDRLVDIVFVMAMTNNPSGGKFEMSYKELSQKNNALTVISNNTSIYDKAVINFPGKVSPYISKNKIELKKIEELIN